MKSQFVGGQLIEPRKALSIAAFCLLEFFLLYKASSLSSLLAIAAIAVSAIYDKRMPLLFYICASLMHVELGTIGNGIAIVIIMVGIIRGLNNKRNKYFNSYLTAGGFFALSIIISHVVGIKSSFIATAVLLFKWGCVFYLASQVIENRFFPVIISLFSMGIAILLYQTFNPITFWSLDPLYNSKDIATSVAIPAYLLLWVAINNKMKFYRQLFFILVALCCIVTMALTYSRGALLSLFVAIGYVLLIGVKNKKIVSIIIIVVLAVVVVNSMEMMLDYERMTSNLEGGNGRTDIWAGFIQIMRKDGIMRLIFGCGPSGLTGLTLNGTYAHSAILDYFFSYGLVGFSFVLYYICTVFFRLRRNNYHFFMGLLILDVLMFFTHGNYAEPLFLFILGLCMGAACLTKEQVGMRTSNNR